MAKVIKKHYLINAPAEKIWEALVNPKLIAEWGGGPAKMDGRQGTKFSLWGGDISGTNTAVVKYKSLRQDWVSGKWQTPSKLEINLNEKNGKTKVELTQSGVPAAEVDDIDQGWDDYYFGPLKKLVEKV